jgi:hypothetical protein
VYKKYIKRGGKIYGPYSYKSVKKDGKVITEYIGKSPEKQPIKKYFLLGVFGIVILLSLLLIVTLDLTFIGKVTLDVESNYQQDQFIDGILKFSLEKNEIIPASTNVIISSGDISYDYTLSDLISDQTIFGNFSIKDKSISGSGEGYGFISTEAFPTVSFTMGIYSEITEEEQPEDDTPSTPTEEQSEIIEENITSEEPKENVSEEPTEETIQEETQEVPEEPVEDIIQEETSEEPTEETIQEEPTEEPKQEKDEAKQEKDEAKQEKDEAKQEKEEAKEKTPITGAIIAEFTEADETEQASLKLEETIQGEVSLNNPFSYELEEGQIARIISSSQDINLITENNITQITTEYEEETKELIINLTELDIPAKEGAFTVTLIYQDIEIISATKRINIKTTEEEINITNITIIPEEITNQTLFAVGTDKATYSQNETIDISGSLIINGIEYDGQIILDIEINQSIILTSNVSAVNGSYEYSLIANFEEEGSYLVSAHSGDLTTTTDFYFIAEVFDLGNYKCKKFNESILWSSGYAYSEEGAINYETWEIQSDCPAIDQNCLLHNINTESRVFYASPDDTEATGEAYIQISELSDSNCENPEKGKYSKYVVYEAPKEEVGKWERHCEKNGISDENCDTENSYNQQEEASCYGIKAYAPQYSIIDVIEVSYTWCWGGGE